MDKIQVVKLSVDNLLQGNISGTRAIIEAEYPFQKMVTQQRRYTDKEKINQFKRDGFIDRYTGQKLVNPGVLKVMSYYMPDIFPYHVHWKMEHCHAAYWELVPTVDHIYPIALGGKDNEENWATTSMIHNAIKSNWTVEQLKWKMHDAGNMKEYDGFSTAFVQLVEADENLLKDEYIKRWYKLSLNIL